MYHVENPELKQAIPVSRIYPKIVIKLNLQKMR